jgi:Spy/CpxP family protein refolding chaperone
MNSKPRTILILVGLFLAGAASGVFLALRLAPEERSRLHERRPYLERNLGRLDEALAFTPAQRAKVEEVVRATGEELAKLRRESRLATMQQIRAMNAQIEALLTPEQRVKFSAFQREQFERLRHRQTERDQRHRPAHPGEAPPLPPDSSDEVPPPPPPN